MSGGDSRQDVTLRIKKNAENNYVVMTETNDEIKIEANSGSYLDVLLELEDALKKTDWDDMNHNDTIEITFEIMGNNKPRQVEVHISRESYDISVDRETPKGLGWLTGMFADGRSG